MLSNENTFMEVLLKLKWKSFYALHEDLYFAKINLWRDCDIFPKNISQELYGRKEGDILKFHYKAGELFKFQKDYLFEISPQLNFKPPERYKGLRLRLGRFYPLSFFRFLPGIHEGNPYPGRIISINTQKETLTLDANPPLSKYDLNLEMEVLKIYPKEREFGGRCRDWIEEAFRVGPGMQTRYNHIPTDFGWDDKESFSREDETEDVIFYKEPRFVGHIDRLCHQNLINYYSKIFPDKGRILDLMSSFESHLPEGDYEITGLGINIEELRANRRLKNFLVKDLNQDTILPFESESFDVVVCDLSIEYVVNPLELLKEIKRVLKPQGIVSFSFSNRYFPPKVIKLWVNLHEFERMGYVLELLIKTDFKDLHTYSLRGFPRPEEDRWITFTSYSDPLYVVWGRKP